WTNFTPQHLDAVSKVIERDFNHLTDALLRLHYDFDYLDEEVLADATVEDGKIRVRDEAFEVLILPPLTHVRPTTFRQIERLVAGGGSVIADTLLPMHFIEPGTTAPVSPNGEARDVAGFFGIDPGALLDRFQRGEAGPFNVRYGKGPNGGGNVIVFTGGGLGTAGAEEARRLASEDMGARDEVISDAARDGLKAALDRCITPDVTISEPDVFYLHRVKDGHDVFFLANTVQEDRGRVEVTFERVGRPELWNPNTGTTEPLAVYDVRDGRLVLWLDFPPSEAHVVVIRDGAAGTPVTETNLDAATVEGDAVVGYHAGGEEAFAVVGGARRAGAAKEALAPITLPERYAFRTEEPNA
ncbi:MAG TPA: glycosyl hydrolase, partial [Anaeromyxobacteraceae bacterium]|nr:glycosyl hydrolase [Anaeromyxobacteraceae bacterium]